MVRFLLILALILSPFPAAGVACASPNPSLGSAAAVGCCCEEMNVDSCHCEMRAPEQQPESPTRAPAPAEPGRGGSRDSLAVHLVIVASPPLTIAAATHSIPLPGSEEAAASTTHNEARALLGVWLT